MTTRDEERIRSFLKRGDPAAGEDPSPAEIARRRRAVIEASRAGAQDRSGVAAGLAWAAVVATAILAGALLWMERPGGGSPGPSGASRPVARTDPAREVRPARVLHFVTPSGTRVIWTFDPDFDLHPRRTPDAS